MQCQMLVVGCLDAYYNLALLMMFSFGPAGTYPKTLGW